MKTKASTKRYTVRAVVFQEGDWLCVQCLEYDLVTQAKSLPQLYKAFRRLIVGHIALRLQHSQQPFAGLSRVPRKYWKMFQRSPRSADADIYRDRKQGTLNTCTAAR